MLSIKFRTYDSPTLSPWDRLCLPVIDAKNITIQHSNLRIPCIWQQFLFYGINTRQDKLWTMSGKQILASAGSFRDWEPYPHNSTRRHVQHYIHRTSRIPSFVNNFLCPGSVTSYQFFQEEFKFKDVLVCHGSNEKTNNVLLGCKDPIYHSEAIAVQQNVWCRTYFSNVRRRTGHHMLLGTFCNIYCHQL